MQYQYTSEQSEFKDSLRKFVQDHYDYESRRHLAKEGNGYKAEYWQQLAELGVFGLPFAEEFGGLELDLGYLMGVAEEFGRGLVLEPMFPVLALAGRLLAAGDNAELKNELIPSLIGGELLIALASEEKASRGNPLIMATSVKAEGGELVINGEKHAVYAAPQASQYLVTAKDESGAVKVLLVAADAAGVTATEYQTVDGARASNLRFDNVKVPASASLFSGDAAASLELVIDEALLVMGAEAVGLMDQLMAITGEYLQTRKQFGMPIAAFQALQHRYADMYIACEKIRSLMWGALQTVGTAEFAESAAMLKAEIGKSGRYLGQQAVQLHGGIGMTDELSVGAYFKRLTAMDLILGGRDYQLSRLIKIRKAA
ncbi:acyl-CoA dehydrogenase family protein [Spongiibacter sp. KMU-158]|uniref:Acyl-CoA dehydrogenase family protein n=1 Tax=Spongiibacter pelagi TaxID=2760804 RepID=A0A927GWG0_9GAMM|nr:acyl-CoA dehydrogenase [Spongiibacter pelagi]MBD2858902.1 acyl-CoA dehydrogenase family protein [Spongiibacter pelagi]